MHTPDGFITSWICVLLLMVSLGFLGYAFYDARKWMDKKKVGLMSLLAAGIFAFQMLNFPVTSGTSGHFIGAALVAILISPTAAILVMASVLLVQGLVFADGGFLSLGLNIFNMGIVTAYVSYYTYKSLENKNKWLAYGVASWLSVMAAAFVAAIEFGIGGAAKLVDSLQAMLSVHMFIGIGEALMTVALIYYFKNVYLTGVKDRNISKYVAFSIIGAFAIASFALPFASKAPDGMASVAINMGFYDKAVQIYSIAPMSGYTIVGMEPYLASLVALITGMGLTYFLSYAMTKPIATS